jgi:Cellulase (glycosyl hydrolase family 5)/CARDB
MLRTLILLLLLVIGLPAAAQDDAYNGFYVEGAQLFDGAGEPVVLVGVNKMIIWTDIDGTRTLGEIEQTGANAVRIVWLTSGSAEQLDTVISNTIALGMIPVVDCHDSVGDWSKFDDCVDFWVRPDVVAVITRHEQYVFVNIANEPDPGSTTDSEFKAAHVLAFARIRAAGIRVPLIVDTQGYAGRIDNLQKYAAFLTQADPLRNVMFSVHIYWTPERFGDVDAYAEAELRETADMGIPLIVGEYSAWAIGCTDGVPYETILRVGHELGIGRFAWEWGPGNLDCPRMDMSEDGSFAALREWGLEVAITHPQSIRNTAVRPASLADAASTEGIATAPLDDALVDLVVDQIAWQPETPVRDSEVLFSAVVTNAGGAALAAGTPVRVQFRVNNAPVGVGEIALTDDLAAGDSVTIEMSAPWQSVAGEMIVLASAHTDGDERAITNNFGVAVGVVRLFAS